MIRKVLNTRSSRRIIASLTTFILTSFVRVASSTPVDDVILTDFKTPENIPRLALVIGAQNYDYLDEVPNALQDAEDARRVLESVGFSSARLLPNPREQDIYDAVKELAQRTTVADQPVIVVIFFAGHGFQSNGHTFIAPVDAARNNPVELSIPIADLMAGITKSGRGGLAIFFADSCRTPVTPSDEELLAPPIPGGAILGLATKSGTPARSAAHTGHVTSPFSSALVKYIPSEGLPFTSMFERVRSLVEQLTQDEQSPDIMYGANARYFYFIPTETQYRAEEAAWLQALETRRQECIRKYVKDYPDSRFLRAALRWLSQAGPPDLTLGGVPCPEE